MTDAERVVVPPDMDGVRADRVVAVSLNVARSEARRAIDAGRVRIGDEPVGAAQRLAAGTQLVVELVEKAPALSPAHVGFGVAYEDSGVIVVDKPAGVVVHPGAGATGVTLVEGLVHRYPELGELADHRWGLVHRLDRDTSGLLVVGRSAAAFQTLQEALRVRAVGRTYLALVAGAPDGARGTIDAPIGRDPHQPTRMAVLAAGRPSRTHFRRLASWDDATLLEVRLETGRTHQIRVHFASIGHPVVGDRTYGGRRATHRADPGRQWLHATRLQFVHPVSGDPIDVVSEIPPDLRSTLEALGPPDAGELPV